jgi:hypothetical protein
LGKQPSPFHSESTISSGNLHATVSTSLHQTDRANSSDRKPDNFIPALEFEFQYAKNNVG